MAHADRLNLLHAVLQIPLLCEYRVVPRMWISRLGFTLLLWWPLYFHLHASATILDNGQPRRDPYPGQAQRIDLDESWRRYGADAPEIAYKGRWDSKHISCMASCFRAP